MAEQEGRLTVDEAGHEIYYRLFGEGPETLVGLHGGPGSHHLGIERLGEVADDSLQVLLYDQLGHPRLLPPEGPHRDRILEICEDLVARTAPRRAEPEEEVVEE